MSFSNYGKDGWEIDHILPCKFFNMEDETERKICLHYTNLQPLWKSENCKKKKNDNVLTRS